MTKIGLQETALRDLLAGAFEHGLFGRRELRLCPLEAEYIRSRCPGAELTPAAPPCADGKTWFTVRFGGYSET